MAAGGGRTTAGDADHRTYAPFLAAFREGLNEAGFLDGRNFAIEILRDQIGNAGYELT